jgi:aminopeptidase N
MSRPEPQPTLLSDYRPPAYLIGQVELRFDLDDARTRVTSRLELRRNPVAGTDPVAELRLDGEGLELLALRLDGQPPAPGTWHQDEAGLILRAPPSQFVLETEVAIAPAANTALEGLYRSGPMLCTQCEPEGFRRITFFPDRPDVMARFRTTLVGDPARYPVLLGNGNPVARETLADGRHQTVWDDPFPKPSYLFALVAGDLHPVSDRFRTASGREVALNIYVERQNLDQCAQAMQALRQAMAWDEREYGREYDLDVYNIVAVGDFNMGAMENKGLNIFNAKFVLARPDTATDSDFLGIEGVIAHEYFHNWTGNRITCRDWFQLSLKEGFTVFRDQCFSADMGRGGVKRISDVRLLRSHQFAEDGGPMAHPVRPDAYIEINNFYTATVYEKGAELVRMQRNLLGPEWFRKATDLYFQRHDGQAVTTDDFVRCMEDVSGRDLSQFRRWYRQAGTPELEVAGRFDPAAGCYELTVSQHCPPTPGQPDKQPLHIPFALGLLDAAGRDLPVRLEGEPEQAPGTRVLELREPRQTFRLVGLESAPVPSLLRGFSAPVKLRYPWREEELTFLMAHDSDGFARWDAAQTLAQRVVLGLLDGAGGASAEVLAARVPDTFVTTFHAALTAPAQDQALLAEVLTLPGEAYLGDQLPVVDVDGLHAAREALRRRIGGDLAQALTDRVAAGRETGPYRLTREDVGRRALRNLALGYLMAAGGAAAVALCLEQYQAGHNMTDVIAALALLAASDAPERDAVLADFAARWSGDPLVLDKWFAVQAQSPRPDTLARVESLLGHPGFSLRNPNRVRALIGAFAAGNPVRFHAPDGSGYRFLCDRVLELDPLNPQVAARLLRSLARWRRYDAARQALMQGQLQRVLAAGPLSRDLYEVAARSLG